MENYDPIPAISATQIFFLDLAESLLLLDFLVIGSYNS